jgi:hypothetical protein
MTVGCNAITISELCLEEYTNSKNDTDVLSYLATARQGPKTLVKTYQGKCPDHVFLSSLCKPKDDETTTYQETLYK